MTNKELITILQNVYDNSTLGDLLPVIESLKVTQNKAIKIEHDEDYNYLELSVMDFEFGDVIQDDTDSKIWYDIIITERKLQ